MTPLFSGPSFGPISGGKPDSLVVLLHGYGSDGDDLLSLGDTWKNLLPRTLFVAPHGPAASTLYPSGYQWFNLEDWNPDQPLESAQISRMIEEIDMLTPFFNQYLDDLLKTHDLPPEKLALVGFSQGTMFALHMAIRRSLCAGVVGYSGAFLECPREEKISCPPILLIHGEDDHVVPPSFSKNAVKCLEALRVPVQLSLLPDLEHSIDNRGLGLGGEFLKEKLSGTQKS